MQGTYFSVRPAERIPKQIWQDFCIELPWCSQSYQFGNSAQNTLLALLFASLLDNCITWCQYDKLIQLASKFREISLDTKGQPQFINKFYSKLNFQFSEIIMKVQPQANIATIASSSARLKALKEDLQNRRQFIQDQMQGPNLEIMANISRGIAMSVYLQNDFHSITTLQYLLKKYSREQIIRQLLTGQELQKIDHFILDDYILLPISFSLQIPIYYYLNHIDIGGSTLTRRRIHAQNEEQVLIFLIENGDNGNARTLIKYHPSIAIKNHTDFFQNLIQTINKPTIKIQSKQSDSQIQKNLDLFSCLSSIIEQMLKQMAIENSKISQLWLKKINEIIQRGDTQQLISKKQLIQLQPQLLLSIKDLHAIMNSDQKEESSFSSFLTNSFESTLLFFENLLITQVTLVRDNLFEHIASIKVPLNNKKDQTLINLRESPMPCKPKILDKQALFNRNKLENTNQTFLQQKVISNQCHIEAKIQDQDLPDPSENLTDFEVDSELSSLRLSISQVKQKHNGQFKLAQIEEYHTSDDEIDSKDKQNLSNPSSSSQSQEIYVEDVDSYDYQKIIDGDKSDDSYNLKLNQEIDKKPLQNIQQQVKSISKTSHQIQQDEYSGIDIPQEIQNHNFTKNTAKAKINQKKASNSIQNYSSNNQPSKRISFQQMYIQRVNGGRSSIQGRTRFNSNLEALDDFKSQEIVNLTGSLGQKFIEDSNDKISFVPNNSKKSTNILNRMTRSQATGSSLDFGSIKNQQKYNQFRRPSLDRPTKDYDLLDQSKISESDELRGVNSSIFMEFLCPICYETYSNYQDIKNIHDNHKICVACLESWIKVKFNSGQWNLKYFKCPIQQEKQKINQECDHLIDIELIKQVLNDEEFGKLCERSMQVLDIKCPWEDCQVSIRGMPPKNSDGIKCPDCEREICWVCRGKTHEGRLCPQRLQEIKGALLDERIGCCPECLEIYMKNEGCQHVQCFKCVLDFCFACSAPREPIMKHGTHYHRVGCEYRIAWTNPDTNEEVLDEEYDPVDCEICKKTKLPCARPLDLISFKRLAHMNF